MKRVIAIAAAGMAMGALSASANYTSITINDNIPNPPVIVPENNEVEPSCIASQGWDLEQFGLDVTAKKLNMIGGYNFQTGMDSQFSGDIFIGAGVTPVYGNSNPFYGGPSGNAWQQMANSEWGYNYAIVFERANQGALTPQGGALTVVNGQVNYKVVALGTQSDVIAWYDQNFGASPFRVAMDAPTTGWDGKATFGSFTGQNNSGQGVSGMADWTGTGSTDTHYYLTDINVNFLAGKGDTYFHYTMGCGNDSLMGRATGLNVPDGGMTVSLLGMAFAGLGVASRRIRKN